MDDIKNLKIRYRNRRGDQNNIGDQFLRPCLNEFSRWRRCSLGFSSSALKTWAGSLVKIVKTENKKIEILCDIYASAGDTQLMQTLEHCSTEEGKIEALRRYQENIIITAFAADQSRGESQDFKKKYGWKLLHYLIAKGQLEIKFAINTISDGSFSNIYHEKAGYFEFPDGSKVGHEGSFNESDSGHRYNNESVSVFSSFREGDSERLNQLINDVDEDWIGSDSVHVMSLSPQTLEIIKKNAPVTLPKPELQPDTSSDSERDVEAGEQPDENSMENIDEGHAKQWGHQAKALATYISSEKNEYSIDGNLDKRNEGEIKGILSMATGTGKTSTSLRIAKELFQRGSINKILIVPPNNKSLCKQWYESVMSWRTNSNLTQLRVLRHYEDYREVERFKSGQENLVLINKRDAESLNYLLAALDRDKTLIIHDEVHGFGTAKLQELAGLQKNFRHTLGLSATPEREYDEEGTEFIFEEIGKPVFSYPLEDAISNGTLCPFKYHEIKVLQSAETSKKISSAISSFKAQKKENPGIADTVLATRIAGIRAEDENKIPSLRYFLQENKEMVKNSIIFCATHEQGDEVGAVLNKWGISFTRNYAEDPDDQQSSINELASNRIDTIINCHTLSEGIDIRSLNNIFLLSSYRSKLETIQRVGRCIRSDQKNPEKVANVIDLVLYKDIQSNDEIQSEAMRRDWLLEVSKIRKHG